MIETLAAATFGAGLTWVVGWLTYRRELRRLQLQRSTEKTEDALRAVDALELTGPTPAHLTFDDPSEPRDELPDRKAANAAIAVVRNSTLLIDDRNLRERVAVALNYLTYTTFPGTFKTLPVHTVWPTACRDIRECLAAHARGEKLPDPPEMYAHFEKALWPLRESMERLREVARAAVDRMERERNEPS